MLEFVRRVQIHLDEDLDSAAAAEAARRGMSKAELIRLAVAKEVAPRPTGGDVAPEGWDALIGWLDDEPVGDIDAALYGSAS